MFDRQKDECPEITVSRMRETLGTLGITMQASTISAGNGLYSARLTDPIHRWGTNGKGSTAAYCLASAYGEALERLQNQMAYNKYVLSDEANAYGAFFAHPTNSYCHLPTSRCVPRTLGRICARPTKNITMHLCFSFGQM